MSNIAALSNFLGKKVGEEAAERRDGKSEDEVQFPAKIVFCRCYTLHSATTVEVPFFGKIRKQPVILYTQ